MIEVNGVDSKGRTILHSEDALSSLYVFKKLVESSAELVPDNECKTPYDIAKATNKKEIVQFIEERVSKNFVKGQLKNQELTSQEALEIIAVHSFDTFIKATGAGATAYLLKSSGEEKGLSAGLATLLIKHSADVNAKNEYAHTPLHFAAKGGLTEVAKSLIANCADVNTKDNSDSTPLHWAARGGSTEVAKLLIENSADVNAKAKWGDTALHTAAENGSTEVAKLLIENGADVYAIEKYDNTPLHLAAFNGHAEVTKLLIANSPNGKAKEGYDGYATYLHTAAYSGSTEVAKLLIENGADVNAKSGIDGHTPLHEAASRGRTEVAKLLIENGADVNAKDKRGDTPFSCARLYHREVAELLRKAAEKEASRVAEEAKIGVKTKSLE